MEADTQPNTLPAEKVAEVRSVFRDFLKERGLRQTPERFSVLNEVYSTPGHFEADDLYTRMKSKGERVSRATVYNTLELLEECNLVDKHRFGNHTAKYERSYSYHQHDHLICVDCGAVLEFCDPRIQSIKEMVADVYEFDIDHHSLEMYGRCRRPDCPGRKGT